MSKPGLVKLDTISGIVDGKNYDLDIFHCDRRTEMSNFVLTTNIYMGPEITSQNSPPTPLV